MTEVPSITRRFSRRQWIGLTAASAATVASLFAYRRFGRGEALAATPVTLPEVTLYSEKDCPCCHKWAAYMQANGFVLSTVIVADVNDKKNELNVPDDLRTCHTAQVGGYIVEGHVPAGDIKRFLSERSVERGLAVRGMPGGSPGMESDPKVPYEVLAFRADGTTRVFARA